MFLVCMHTSHVRIPGSFGDIFDHFHHFRAVLRTLTSYSYTHTHTQRDLCCSGRRLERQSPRPCPQTLARRNSFREQPPPTQVFKYVYVCVHVCMHVCMYVCVIVCTCVCSPCTHAWCFYSSRLHRFRVRRPCLQLTRNP